MLASPPQDTPPAPQPPEQYAAAMLGAGKSKEDVWQALVNRHVDPMRATEIVTAVASGDGVQCSGCKALVLRSAAALSTSGEPLCQSCSARSDVVEWQRRAAETLGPESTTRLCWRCKKPSMSCIETSEVRWRRGARMPSYTFKCSACGHSFTGYGGPMPVLLSFGTAAVMVAVAVVRQPLRGGDFASLIVGAAISLFFFYKLLVWRLNPKTF